VSGLVTVAGEISRANGALHGVVESPNSGNLLGNVISSDELMAGFVQNLLS
jgi:hypothetical protein